jgi:CMP/dCMP kinase
MIIAIDGPAASGKGTVARRLATHLGYHYLDTGAIYRAVGLAVMRAGGDPADADLATLKAQTLDLALTEDPEIRTDAAGSAASKVGAVGAVRAALLQLQRDFAARPPGAVLDGRDIGTVVCPTAAAKVFVTADVEERARRRHKELLGRGLPSIYARVLEDLQERDRRDAGRADAPMVQAPDAILVDTTRMTPDEAFQVVLDYVASRHA